MGAVLLLGAAALACRDVRQVWACDVVGSVEWEGKADYGREHSRNWTGRPMSDN